MKAGKLGAPAVACSGNVCHIHQAVKGRALISFLLFQPIKEAIKVSDLQAQHYIRLASLNGCLQARRAFVAETSSVSGHSIWRPTSLASGITQNRGKVY